MEYIEKAGLAEQKKKLNIIKISVIATICMIGVVLGIYSAFMEKFLYTLFYVIAVIPGFAYVIIKINAVMPSYIAVTDNAVYMQCWKNRVFPYKIDCKFKFLADFVPETVIKDEILIKDIESIIIGNRTYIARNIENTAFEEETDKISEYRKTEKSAIRKMDFICIVKNDKQIFYMPITDMDYPSLSKIINFVHRNNLDASIKCNLKDLREKLTYDKN